MFYTLYDVYLHFNSIAYSLTCTRQR